MDRERLGRVLGKGARLAARTAIEAVDAATSPSPTQPAAARQSTAAAQPEILTPRPAPARAPVAAATPPKKDFSRAAATAKQGMAAPLKRASRALWHEFTGTFFALFALSFLLAAWKVHDRLASPVAAERYRFYSFCVLGLVFGYFSVSSFLRARRA